MILTTEKTRIETVICKSPFLDLTFWQKMPFGFIKNRVLSRMIMHIVHLVVKRPTATFYVNGSNVFQCV